MAVDPQATACTPLDPHHSSAVGPSGPKIAFAALSRTFVSVSTASWNGDGGVTTGGCEGGAAGGGAVLGVAAGIGGAGVPLAVGAGVAVPLGVGVA